MIKDMLIKSLNNPAFFLPCFIFSLLLLPLNIPIKGGMMMAYAHAEDAVIAVVNNEKIHASQLEKLVKIYRAKSQKKEITPEQLKQLVNSLVTRNVILQHQGVKALKSNSEIRQKVKKFEDDLIISKFVTEYVNTRSAVTEEETRNFYNDHKNQFIEDKIPTVSVIMLRTQKEAELIYAKVSQGEDFSELASEFSLDLPSAQRGGSLGQVSETTVSSEIWDAIMKLEPGQISEIIKVRYGYTIVKLDTISPKKVMPYDTVKEQVRKSFIAKQKKEIYDTMVDTLKKDATIKIFDERVLELSKPTK